MFPVALFVSHFIVGLNESGINGIDGSRHRERRDSDPDRNIGQRPAFNVRRGNGVCIWESPHENVRREQSRCPFYRHLRLCVPFPSRSREMPSRVFDFEVIDCIGEGAGSKIYVVSHEQTQQLYASSTW